jgi:hypothetical protein
METAERTGQLQGALRAVGDDGLRQGLRLLPPAIQQKIADETRTKVPVLVRGKPTRFLDRLTDTTLVLAVADAVTNDCLEEAEAILGDSWDDPTEEELVDLVEQLLDHHPAPVVATLLAAVVASEANAAAIAEGLLDKDPRLAIADIPDDTPPSTSGASPAARRREASPEQREARRARKEAERERKRKRTHHANRVEAARRAAQKEAKKAAEPAPVEEPVVAAEAAPVRVARPEPEVVQGRREPALTPDERAVFDIEDPLCGSVVSAEIVFDHKDPHPPELDRKRRPCVVVAVSAFELLVRAGYSEGSVEGRTGNSHPLRDWKAAKLDGPSWIEERTRRVARSEASPPIGRLSDRDWNALW